jgi:hypothetical protein
MPAPIIQQLIDDAWAADKAEADAALAAVQATLATKDALLASSQTQTAAAQQALVDLENRVEGVYGPMWDASWHKQDYRGFALNTAGYHETFRSDFDDLSQITNNNGNGPWFSGGPGVHPYFGNAFFDSITQNPQLFAISEPSVLRLRMMTPDGNVATSWRSTIMQTMRDDGVGWSQSKGIFEVRARMPPAPAVGFWGAPLWLKGASDYHNEITEHLIEIDLAENYGAQPTATAPGSVDKGIHTTVHVIPRKVPLPGEYPTRVSLALYSDPQTVFNTDPTTGGASTVHTYPSSTAVFDGQFHTYTIEITDDWVTSYFDGLSVGRIANKNGFFSTPLYMLVNQTLKRPSTNIGLTSPVDMYIDYVRAQSKA